MKKQNCLSLCLSHITGYKRWYYEENIAHQWKKDIRYIGLLIGRDIKYRTGNRPKDKEYIGIYNTGHGTTHALVQRGNEIIYNPYKVRDLKGTNGYIELSQI